MKKSTKVMLYGIPSVLLLSCGGGLLGFAHKSQTDRDLAIVRLAKVGLPTDPDQIRHIPDPNKDAGALLKEFKSKIRATEKTPAGKKFFDPETKDVRSRRAFVQAHPELLLLRRELFTKTELATQTEPELGYGQEFAFSAAIRRTIKLALAESQILSDEEKPVEALELLAESSTFVKILHTDPNHLAEIISLSLQRQINRDAMKVFATASERNDVQVAMRAFLRASDPTTDIRRAIAEGVARALAMEASLKNGTASEIDLLNIVFHEHSTPLDPVIVQVLKTRGVKERIFAVIYQSYAELYAALPADPTRHKQRMEVATKWEGALSKLPTMDLLLLDTIRQNYAWDLAQEANLRAEWRTLNALLIASELKSKTGKYPTTLPVTGQDAIDPFTDKPLKYLLKSGKLTIYSVGQDLSDDNGLLFRPTTSSSGGSSSWAQDTGFSIPYDVPARLR